MNSFLHQASFATGYWCYDRHRSVRLVVLVGLAIDQIAQSGLSSLSVIYYSAQLFRRLSFSAYKSVNSTVGFHELQSTGTKHTQNMLLHEINKYISFIDQSDVDYSKPRYDKMPILSVERQLYDLFNLEPAILYNEVPSIGIVENCMLLDEF
ncbi:hypothetical protein [Klebsiella pneumoniae]|uniref:hypothetical protein n=1 Tax=Klebsiella pneumoniae TaxID=573 RepID=UPI0009BB1EF0|nr:hypothetical protein [Klebsiella pneumoniae]